MGRRGGLGQRGFTLTEMMVVVAVFSVLTVVALGGFSRGRKAGEVDAFARAIQRTVTLARRRALDTNRRYLVDLRPRSVAYCELPAGAQEQKTCPSPGLESPPAYQAGDAVEIQYFARAADYDRTVEPAPNRTTIDQGTALYMLPNGSCDSDLATPLTDGFTAYLRATYDPLQRRTVAVFPLTARPRITDNW